MGEDTSQLDAIQALALLGVRGRQAAVAALLYEGLTEAEAADRLCIAPSTVHDHMKKVYAHLGIHSRVELVRRIFDNLTKTP